LGGESDVNMKASCLERIAIYQDLYSKYIDMDYKKAEKILITGYCPLKLLIKAGMTDFNMYYHLWWRFFQIFVKDMLYYKSQKDGVFFTFLKKQVIEPRVKVIKSRPANLDEYLEARKK
jgi:hypothetical protein